MNLGEDLLPLVAACLTTVSCALVGCFLVLRRMSMMGDAISHSLLPGIALAVILANTLHGWPIFVGAMAVGVLMAWLADAFTSLGKVNEDAALGVAFTSLFALGVALIHGFVSHIDLDPSCVIMGSMETLWFEVSFVKRFGIEWSVPEALGGHAFVFATTVALLALFWKELALLTFDSALARSFGLPVRSLHYGFLALVSGVVVSSFEAVGSILVVAMLVVPAATAQLLVKRLHHLLFVAAALAALATLLGHLTAVAIDTAEAGAIAVASGGLFLLALVFAPGSGLLYRGWRAAALALHVRGQDILADLFRAEETPAVVRRQTGWLDPVARLALRGRGALATDGRALTERGREEARSLVRAHRLWESYLSQNFDLPPDHLHDPAHRIEHYLDAEMQRRLAQELGQPATDPHGRAIPSLSEPPPRE